MFDAFKDVLEFHKFFGHVINRVPTWLTKEQEEFRLYLINEELTELKDALAAKDMVEVADALADLVYVIVGTAVAMGIPLDYVWQAVHQSNMSKAVLFVHGDDCAMRKADPANPVKCDCGAVQYKPDGKTAKPEGWKAPTEAIQFLLDRFKR